MSGYFKSVFDYCIIILNSYMDGWMDGMNG